jgi:hypothetical protein
MYWYLALWSHNLVWYLGFEFQPFFSTFHTDGLAFMELAAQYFNRQRVLQFTPDGPFEGTGTVISIIANLGQV